MARVPQSRRTLSGEFKKVRARANDQTTFAGTGIHFPEPGVVQIDGRLEGAGFDGDLAAGDPGTQGWAADATRMAVGELLLRPGSIGNEALANPVVPGVVNVRNSGFAIPIPYTEVAWTDIPVPAGCTRLLANITAWVQGYNTKTSGGNNGAGGDYVYARVKIGSTASAANTPTGVSGNGGTATASMGLGTLLTGLTPGDTVHIAAVGGTDYGIDAHPTNEADFSGTLIWLR